MSSQKTGLTSTQKRKRRRYREERVCVGAWMRESVSVCVSVCAFEAKREMNRGREKKKRKIVLVY